MVLDVVGPVRALYTVPGSESPRELRCDGFVEGDLGVTLVDDEGEEIAFVASSSLIAIVPE